MRFARFVEHLEGIERVSSRLTMTELLVNLLRDLEVAETKAGIYLMLGSLLPAYEGLEFSMAGKTVVKSLALASAQNSEEVEAIYKEKGDLGEVAKILLKKTESNLTLLEVYEELLRLARVSGVGSSELKQQMLARILAKTGKADAGLVAKIVMGKLRLGFSEKTILDALCQMDSGNKLRRKELDAVYQLVPDAGTIATMVKEQGLEVVVKKPQIKLGIPVVNALCQRLDSSEEMIKKMKVVAVERKFDGTRVQIHLFKDGTVKSFTRNLEESSKQFPELRQLALNVNCKEVVLDAEAVGYDKKTGAILPFQMTITRKRKHGIEEAAQLVPLRFYIFDCLFVDGETVVAKSYEQRREILSKIIKKNDIFVVDDFVKTDSASKIHEQHEKYLQEGFEGAVVKKWDGAYLPGRQGWNWVKIKESEGSSGKLSDTLDLVVMGYYLGKGKRAGFGIGAFLVGTRVDEESDEIVTVAKIGTGITDELFAELKSRLDLLKLEKLPKEFKIDKNLMPEVLVKPKLIVEIAADEITKSPIHSAGVALRFPRLIKLRDDKGLDGVTTLAEIKKIGGIEVVESNPDEQAN